MSSPGRQRRDNIIETVLHACRGDGVLGAAGGHVVVVAVSGGPDSTALLHALSRSARRLRLELVVVHVDHDQRSGSANDARVVAGLAAELGLAHEEVRVSPRGGDEEALRSARYAALERVARRVGAGTIALGHTADDQAETVLLHVLRGAGLDGLAAMRVREGLRFRPLLGAWRSQVEAYCAARGLDPLHDPTNDDQGFTRNRVRAELLPFLEQRYNARVKEALVRLAEAAAAEHDAVVALAERWSRGRRGAVPRAAFNGLPEAVRAEVVRRAWQRAAGLEALPGGSRRLAQALRLAARPGPGMIQLGGGFEFVVDAAEVAVRSRETTP